MAATEVDLDPKVIKAVTSAHVAVNVATYFLYLVALSVGLMSGVLNGADEQAPDGYAVIGFALMFLPIAIGAFAFGRLMKVSIAHPEVWKQALVWSYCLVLLSIFPIGTGLALVIVHGQVKWMRNQPE